MFSLYRTAGAFLNIECNVWVMTHERRNCSTSISMKYKSRQLWLQMMQRSANNFVITVIEFSDFVQGFSVRCINLEYTYMYWISKRRLILFFMMFLLISREYLPNERHLQFRISYYRIISRRESNEIQLCVCSSVFWTLNTKCNFGRDSFLWHVQ